MESIQLDDPTDWPDTWSPMNQLDQALRCSICSEFFKTAMILVHCSHNFCSLCIRKRIAVHPSCPLCHKEVHESDLRPNRLINELIEIVRVLRHRFITTPCPPSTPNPSSLSYSNSSSSTTVAPTFSLLSTPSSSSSSSSFFTFITNAKKKPTQSTTFPSHFTLSSRSSSSSSSASSSSSPSLMDSTDTRSRLPTPHFHTLTLKDLNALLQRQQLPTTGTRADKIQRYKEYLKHYHANLDALPSQRVSNAQLRTSVLALETPSASSSMPFSSSNSSSSSSSSSSLLHLKKYFSEFQQLHQLALSTTSNASLRSTANASPLDERNMNNRNETKEEQEAEAKIKEEGHLLYAKREQEKEPEQIEQKIKRFKKN